MTTIIRPLPYPAEFRGATWAEALRRGADWVEAVEKEIGEALAIVDVEVSAEDNQQNEEEIYLLTIVADGDDLNLLPPTTGLIDGGLVTREHRTANSTEVDVRF